MTGRVREPKGERGTGAHRLAWLAAQPRPAGSAAEAAVRARCAAELRSLGFAVREEPFTYSSAPGRWGTPLGGVASIALLAGAAIAGASGRPLVALLVLASGATVLGLVGAWTARRGVVDLPLARRTGVNLVATRGAPRVWLVAHLDSKSQPVPIGLRAAGVIGSVLAWLAAAATAAAQLAGVVGGAPWPWVALVGLASGIPVALTTVGARSDGAVDNASGVATVLEAAARLPADAPIGVLLPSAEELGLAGARAWCRGRAPGVALNCDGVDDAGDLVAMYSGRRPAALLAELERAARANDVAFGSRRLVPGILTDGVALADAGWRVVTLSRGTTATLRRIHTDRDDLARLDGSGVEPAATVLAAATYGLLSAASPVAR